MSLTVNNETPFHTHECCKSFVSCKLTWIVLFFLVLLVFSSTCVVIEIEQWGEMFFRKEPAAPSEKPVSLKVEEEDPL